MSNLISALGDPQKNVKALFIASFLVVVSLGILQKYTGLDVPTLMASSLVGIPFVGQAITGETCEGALTLITAGVVAHAFDVYDALKGQKAAIN